MRAMRNELNSTAHGKVVLKAVADRLVEFSGTVHPKLGAVVKASAGTRTPPNQSRRLQWLRWFTAPARGVVWKAIVSGVEHDPTHTPTLLKRWPTLATTALALTTLILSTTISVQVISVALALIAGVLLSATAALLVLRWTVNRAREQLKERCQRALNPTPGETTSSNGTVG